MDDINILDDIILNINEATINIKNINFPIIFLFKLDSYKESFGDYTTSVILRIFFKYNIEFVINNNIKNIFNDIDENIFPLTLKAIIDIYKFMSNKLKLIHIIKNWYNLYNKPEFWNKSLDDQLIYLENLRHYFLSIFDMSKGGSSFIMRANSLLEDHNHNKNITLEEIKSRLVLVLNIFGPEIFNALKIPMISSSLFDETDNKNIIEYMKMIFFNCINMLDETLEIFNQYITLCNDINILLNPIVISINTLEITENYDEDEDISMFC